ncbi:MAG: pantetheine-phosphate adenylyltransferase [Bdellovibrionales bacterium]|nr:pantetheine-phosphate adenylyltransferase [Bdellovibrionales bacterium]
MTALYAGSFDPITLGHIDLIQRASSIFNPLIVLIATSPWKNYHFSSKERCALAKGALQNFKTIQVDICDGLVTEYARKNNIRILIRGIRNVSNLESEMNLSNANKELFPESETFILFSKSKFIHYSSQLVKEIAISGGDVSHMVPPNVQQALKKGVSS